MPLKYYLPEISPYEPLNASCPCCKTKTTFSSHINLNTTEGNNHINYFQCQSCGKLETSDEKDQDGIRVGLETKCECGGQFRKDKNIFCPNCQYRKSEENKAEDNLFATKEEMESLSKRHRKEMAKGFQEPKIESKTEEDADYEEPDFKKLISELREITSDGSTFNFEVSPNGKGNEYIFNVGLDYDLEEVFTEWIDNTLLPEINYNPTEFKLKINENTICLDCSTTSGHWQNHKTYNNEDLFTSDIVKILLPDYEFENVDLEALSLSFHYSQNNKGYHFYWSFFEAYYYDDEKDLNIEIPLDDLKTKLEPMLHEILINFNSGDTIDYEDSCTKNVEVLDGRISILETYEYSLSFDIDDF